MSFKKTGKTETLGVTEPKIKEKKEASPEVKQESQAQSDKKAQK
jgi:hypothetical protein